MTNSDTSIYVYGVDDLGCYSDTMIQNVYLYPPMTLTMSTDTFMCNSDTTLIFALVTGGLGTSYQYSWNSGLSDTSHHLVYPLYSKNYTVTVNDACETPPVSGSVYITVFPLPPADFTVDIIEGMSYHWMLNLQNCFLTLQALVIGILVIRPFLINVDSFSHV